MIVLVGSTLAQNLASRPLPAVAGPAFDVSVGYSHLSMEIPSAGRAGLNGLDTSASISLSPRWGAIVDTSYLRTSDVLSTPHQGYMLSVRGGALFYPFEHGNTRVFVRGLAGGALVDGAVPVNQTQYFHGWLLRPAYDFGGGVEHALSGNLAVRVNADYVRTTFYAPSTAVAAQNNLQLTLSFVFRLKQHQREPRAGLR
jgi:hypothetical protein